ncbi:uncharacterized protein PADG_12431 [Paracoccidioides brasiliensis Pb18]|uniref:Uncharacterized protein n=1 Tax=Paracoccidioides brasiliensis (strain Pb18) TaxID=502780 RepID=A0A0A0HTY6_PARBD|nr:uncharacterized protein PADG_12431 [Paracoccidioides brasiliensis Pb18]KGM91476.1 hypothetical protein PADG_12431 [Paracoccidioides brasiliensis Pb18]
MAPRGSHSAHPHPLHMHLIGLPVRPKPQADRHWNRHEPEHERIFLPRGEPHVRANQGPGGCTPSTGLRLHRTISAKNGLANCRCPSQRLRAHHPPITTVLQVAQLKIRSQILRSRGPKIQFAQSVCLVSLLAEPVSAPFFQLAPSGTTSARFSHISPASA